MSFIQWKDSFSVGVEEIDNQHKKLIQILAGFRAAVQERKGKEAVEATINEMADYAIMHFSTEEKHMLKADYPDYGTHKSEHDNFVEEILSFRKAFTEGKITLCMQVLTFLSRWLSDHILDTDKKL